MLLNEMNIYMYMLCAHVCLSVYLPIYLSVYLIFAKAQVI